jgi:phosphate transport system protein
MPKHLIRDLAELEKSLLYLAAQVEEAVNLAIESLLKGRADLARSVIDGDKEIDRKEVEIEEDCLKILALHQPVAQDLRHVAACLKIDNDLERIGDLAVNIAERVLSSSSHEFSLPDPFREMVACAMDMLRTSIDAFVRADTAAARSVMVQDDVVDRDNRLVIERLLVRMRENPNMIDRALELISVSKNIERIADHATNIAEDVIYLVDGDIIRHQAG